MDANNPLPKRVPRADIGNKPPTLSYTARADVIIRFLRALKEWNPNYTVKVESIKDPDGPMPTELLWKLLAWDDEQ